MDELGGIRQHAMLDVQASTRNVVLTAQAILISYAVGSDYYWCVTGNGTENIAGGHHWSALLLGKTLQPIQQAVSGWLGLIDAKQQYQRLSTLLKTFPLAKERMSCQPASGHGLHEMRSHSPVRC